MGLSNFPSPVEGLLHAVILIVNTIWSVAPFKNMVRLAQQVIMTTDHSVTPPPANSEHQPASSTTELCPPMSRRVSITGFGSLPDNSSNDHGLARRTSTGNTWCSTMECCVCLSRFEAEEEVSELSCKHFFHKACLQKWFDNHHHTTCPLCRSIL